MKSPVDTLKVMRRGGTVTERDGNKAIDAAIAALTGGEAVAYAVYGNAEEYGPVLIPEYCGSEQIIRERVMEKARREGFTGTFAERMAELGWWLAPLYTTPRAAAGMDSMVQRFLAWPLPDSVFADLCATRRPEPGERRSGTNLLSAIEARAMLEHVAGTVRLTPEVLELVAAASDLRQRQRDYLSQPKGERMEEKGRLVGIAAERLDAALVSFTHPALSALPGDGSAQKAKPFDHMRPHPPMQPDCDGSAQGGLNPSGKVETDSDDELPGMWERADFIDNREGATTEDGLPEVMFGKMLEADFPNDTLTFQMEPSYYAAAGRFAIMRADHFAGVGKKAPTTGQVPEVLPAGVTRDHDTTGAHWPDSTPPASTQGDR